MVVSFDLDTERFASTVTPLPSFPARCYHYHLTAWPPSLRALE